MATYTIISIVNYLENIQTYFNFSSIVITWSPDLMDICMEWRP